MAGSRMLEWAETHDSLADILGWTGPRLHRLLASLQNYPLLPGFPFENMFARDMARAMEAAVADAEEFDKEKKYHEAVKSYTIAVGLAKQGCVVDLHTLVNLMFKLSSLLLKTEDFLQACAVAIELLQFMPDFYEGYIVLSTAARKGYEIQAYPACHLFAAMEHCQLTDDQNVEVIVDASQILASLILDIHSGKDMQHEKVGIEQFHNVKPKMPNSKTVWSRVFQQLLTSHSFAAMALLSVGLPGGDISLLNCFTQNIDVDCSKMEVEQIYEALTPSDVETWGDKLAIFIFDHGGGIGRQTDVPVGVHLVRLALKQKSLVLLQHVFQKVGEDILNINGLSPEGDTTLHVVVKSPPLGHLHQRLVCLLLSYGAEKTISDADGKTPDEYVDKTSIIYKILHGKVQETEISVPSPVEHLKSEGNQALEAKNYTRALECYKKAVTQLQRNHPHSMQRDLAILYSNMAAVHTDMKDIDAACAMARKSIEQDPTYHKPYWRLGKLLLEKGRHYEACEQLLLGAGCKEANCELQSTFLLEICRVLSSLTDKQVESVLDRMQPYLASCWPKMAECLTKNSFWDTVRRLVLGPPELVVNKSTVPAGWKFADRFKDGSQVKVGYAMCLKASTHDLSTFMEEVENKTLPGIDNFATDFILALLLQGAQLETLAVSEDQDTCYHMALNLCCLTEKFGLLRYILSDEVTLKKAQQAVNQEKRTLLHTVCLYFGDGTHEVGKEIVKLLLEKGFDPTAKDMLLKKAEDYLAPESPMTRLLSGRAGPGPQTAEELTTHGNSLFKKKHYHEAVASFSKAIDMLSATLPSLVDAQGMMGHEKEKHELAILFCNRAQCHLRLRHLEQALSDAKESVAWDGHWYRGHMLVGQTLLEQNKSKKAVRAFTNAYNTLNNNPDENPKIEVLKGVMKCLVHMAVPVEPPPPLPNLNPVTVELWAKVGYNFLCKGNSNNEKRIGDPLLSWTAGQYAVTFCNKLLLAKPMSHTPVVKLDLRPLCSWLVPAKFMEAFEANMMFLLLGGSDHTRLSFYEGDTYVHAASCFTIMRGYATFLNYVVERFAQPRREENLQDSEGNTVLHLMALPCHRHLPTLTTQCRLDMLGILLNLGLNPCIRNKQGKLPVECLLPDDDPRLKKVLEKAARRVPRRPSSSRRS